ncbi:MAG TPA: Fis family transcriptional regulator [Anaeromyxobacteraceae bacterium]|nr:Fis family transcriptional regulator [Anaeromyxobacteraceae bacterium]
MPELDLELVARAVRWCEAAGRKASAEDVRRALAPLSWHRLLAVKATLADPPPAPGLGPLELVALASGAAPPLPAPEGSAPPAAAESTSPRRRREPKARGRRAAAGPRIRRASERREEPSAHPAPRPSLEELFEEEGRAILDRLLRRLGAGRPALTSAIEAGWRRRDGAPVTDADLGELLAHHGLERAFAERERALVLHTLRKEGGIRPRAARELGYAPEALESALDRLGLRSEAESLREERRRDYRRRATLAERARLLAMDPDALGDVGLLGEVEADLRRRLPEHLRALRAGGARPPLDQALADSLSLPRAAVAQLAERLGLEAARPAPPGPASWPVSKSGQASRAPRRGKPSGRRSRAARAPSGPGGPPRRPRRRSL